VVKISLTVVVCALNEEDKIRNCLESVRWADEIIVMDAGSTDKTPDIASEYADMIIRSEDMRGAIALSIGCEYASSEWILPLDADEVIPEPLKNEILENIQSDKYNGFIIRRKDIICGKYELGEEEKLKIVRRRKAKIPRVSQHFYNNLRVEGRVKRLKNFYLHFRDFSVEVEVSKLNKYTTNVVNDKIYSGNIPPFKKRNIVIKPILSFFYYYLSRGYIKKGVLGLFYSLHWAYYKLVEEMKLWEYHFITQEGCKE